MPGDGKGRVGWSSYDPYRAWYVNLGYFPWMEFNLRLTRFGTMPRISDGYGPYKDKAIDLKFLTFKQDQFKPNVAFGVTDILGTKIMQAYYSVATYKWENLALTWGYGTDRLNGFFGGVSWRPVDWLEVKAEYSPLDYSYDTIGNKQVLEDDPDQKWNAGFVAETPWGVDVSASYQRGDELCFSLSYNLDLSKPLFGGNKPEYKGVPQEEMKLPSWQEADLEQIALDIVKMAGQNLGVRDVEVFMGDKKVMVAYENTGYSSQGEAMARMMVLASSLLPWDVEEVYFAVKLRGKPVTVAKIPGHQCGLLRLREIRASDEAGSAIYWCKTGPLENFADWELKAGPGETLAKGRHEIKAMISYEPRIDRTLQEDYMARWNVDWIYQLRFNKGLTAFLDVRQPVENDIDIYWEPETNDETRIWKGVLSYLLRFGSNTFGIAEAGWLDAQWIGGNAWLRHYADNGRWWIGGRASLVHERDPYEFASLADEPVTFKGDTRITSQSGYPEDEWWLEYWLQAGYHDPVYDLDLTGEYGTYIDGDSGVRLSATRWWDDVGVGFWIARTDNLTQDKNYSNSGMYLNIPVDAWWGASSAHTWKQEFSLLSTWNYYAARRPGSWQNPDDLLRQLNPDILGRNLYTELSRFCTLARGDIPVEDDGIYSLYDYLSGDYRYDH